MLQFDEEAGRRLEALYTSAEAVARRAAVLEALLPRRGERGLDIGTGPGFLAAELARLVGGEGRVTAVDLNPAMLGLAETRLGRAGLAARVELRDGDATALPVADGGFDFAASVQVFEYVPDAPRAVAEAFRALRPGGRLAVVATDWDTLVWQADDGGRSARVVRAWGGHLAHQSLPRQLAPMLRGAGFVVDAARVLPVLNTEYDPASYSAGALTLVADYVRGKGEVTAEDVAAWISDVRAQGERGTYYFSLNQYLFLARRPFRA